MVQAEPIALRALVLANEASVAAESGAHEVSVEKLQGAVALRPDMPRLLENLAAAQAAAGRRDDAIQTLRRLAELGIGASIERAEAFLSLRGHSEFSAVSRALAANLHPEGAGEIAFTLRDVTGLMEGIAWRQRTGEFLFGDVNGRAVWLRQKDGTLRRFTREGEGLLGVFALGADEERGALWAATVAVPEMQGFAPDDEGRAALVEIDLATGALRQSIPAFPRPGGGAPLLRDVAVAPDGTVYLTDRRNPVLWRLSPGRSNLEPFLEDPEFLALQGLVPVSNDVLLLADQLNGLLRVELSSRRVVRLEAPPGTTLVGVDGLTLAPDGQLIAIQAGIRPVRILCLELEPDAMGIRRVTVLERGHPAISAPSAGCIAVGGDFYFIGNPGWNRFAVADGRPTPPRSIAIFRTRVPK